MTTISNTTNLNAHYSNNHKVEPPKRTVVSGPETITVPYLYGDIEANKRIQKVDNEIKKQSIAEKNNSAKKFFKVFGAIVIGIITLLGLKRIFK